MVAMATNQNQRFWTKFIRFVEDYSRKKSVKSFVKISAVTQK